MKTAQILRILGLIDTAVDFWEENGQDEADLFALRDQLEGLDHNAKIALLQQRSVDLQDRADELRDR